MKSTQTATVHFEDGTEVTHNNVTHAHWEGDALFVVQRFDPENESRLQTFVYKRENVRFTMRGEVDTPSTNLLMPN